MKPAVVVSAILMLAGPVFSTALDASSQHRARDLAAPLEARNILEERSPASKKKKKKKTKTSESKGNSTEEEEEGAAMSLNGQGASLSMLGIGAALAAIGLAAEAF